MVMPSVLDLLLLILALQNNIVFRYWEPTYEDSLSLIARLPVVAAYVYRRSVKCMMPN